MTHNSIVLKFLAATMLWLYPLRGEGAESRIPTESLAGANGQTVSLAPDADTKIQVICFLGTECPMARHYGPRLQLMAESFAGDGVRFIGVVSNAQDSMDEVQHYVDEHKIRFPVAKDYDGQVASALGATRTPEVFVIVHSASAQNGAERNGEVRYQGRIDDQYQPGVVRSEARQHDLRDAIESLIAGREPVSSKTDAVGCLIGRHHGEATDFSVTYCDQVVRVLRRHCVECHRDGEIGPFSLDDYDEVVGWADMSLEVIDQGRMPPWHASPDHGSFANSRHMPDSDQRLLHQWVQAGMPYGNPDNLPLPAEYVDGWRLPEPPHLVLPMSDRPFAIPASGTVEYQYFVLDPKFSEDMWVRAAEVIPGNSAVVHHCIAFTRPPDGSSFRDIGLLSAYVPGQIRSPLPDGYAQKIPAGSRIVFQMHYTPSGKPEEDLTRLGLVFARADEVSNEVITLGGIQQEFEIPPGAEHHVVEGQFGWYPRNGVLLSITPHMHLRGKSFEFRADRNGGSEVLLQVPAYDFNWQHSYELSTPLPLNQVRNLSFTSVFDNSTENPFNPDPAELVTWGDQTWQEMAVTFLSVARPLHDEDAQRETDTDESAGTVSKQAIERHERIEREARAFAERYIKKFDRNQDHFLTSHELPDSVRIFSYWQLDHNGDGRIVQEEIYLEALNSGKFHASE